LLKIHSVAFTGFNIINMDSRSVTNIGNVCLSSGTDPGHKRQSGSVVQQFVGSFKGQIPFTWPRSSHEERPLKTVRIANDKVKVGQNGITLRLKGPATPSFVFVWFYHPTLSSIFRQTFCVQHRNNNMIMRHTLTILLFLVSIHVMGQEGFKGERFIEVSGIAETEVDPNEITLFIRLREFEENRNKVSLEKLDQDFIAALKAAGIDRKRLALADVGSRLEKLTKREKDAFRDKSYEIVLNSASELDKLMEKLEPVKVNLVRITRIHHSEMEKFKTDVKVKALQAAKTKAETLMRGIGAEIGKPLMVREWEEGPVYPMAMENVQFKMAAEEYAAEEPAPAFKKIRLRAQVTAQFAIQ
jgi:uncharacterized protein